MKRLTLPKDLLNPISLPGMGRSIELNSISAEESAAIRGSFVRNELYVQFYGEEGTSYTVINIWPDPHDSSRLTLFIK